MDLPQSGAITPDGLAALKRELAELESTGRREMAQRILVARGHGDLSENAEYHAAKEDQAHLETRIKRLRQRLREAVVVEPERVGDRLSFGGTAEVIDEATGAVETWTIVGAAESDRSQGRLSAESPVGKALLGAATGEQVEVTTPRGSRRLRVLRLS